jgi:hypothetical protein
MNPNHSGGRCDFGDSAVFGTWAERDSDNISHLYAIGHLDSESERTDIHSLSHFGCDTHLRVVGRSTALPTFRGWSVKTIGNAPKGATARVSVHGARYSKRCT